MWRVHVCICSRKLPTRAITTVAYPVISHGRYARLKPLISDKYNYLTHLIFSFLHVTKLLAKSSCVFLSFLYKRVQNHCIIHFFRLD